MNRSQQRPRTHRRPPSLRAILIASGIYTLLYAVLCAALYFTPVLEDPHRADAIVVLGVPKERLYVGTLLAEEGYADTIVISTPDPIKDAKRVPATCHTGLQEVRVECFTPSPFTTEGEALHVQQLAAERGWDDIIVVTYVSHINRARQYFARCVPGVSTTFVGVNRRYDAALLINRFVYETGAWLKLAALGACR